MPCAHARLGAARPIFGAFSPARSVSDGTGAPPRLHSHGHRPCGPDDVTPAVGRAQTGRELATPCRGGWGRRIRVSVVDRATRMKPRWGTAPSRLRARATDRSRSGHCARRTRPVSETR
ncbi:hypothetical protein AcV7_003485 [Taiwanofungus camphoratus]|nr:hypothetical protein AcV7_003485 [Antrodia cinnamomea]